MSKTFKIIRTETIQEEMIVEAKNEEEAISKCGYENWENAQVLSSDTDVEEVNEQTKKESEEE
jgi:hypothetical protein